MRRKQQTVAACWVENSAAAVPDETRGFRPMQNPSHHRSAFNMSSSPLQQSSPPAAPTSGANNKHPDDSEDDPHTQQLPKFPPDTKAICQCEDGRYIVTILKYRGASSGGTTTAKKTHAKPYKIRFLGYGRKYDSWCEEECLITMEDYEAHKKGRLKDEDSAPLKQEDNLQQEQQKTRRIQRKSKRKSAENARSILSSSSTSTAAPADEQIDSSDNVDVTPHEAVLQTPPITRKRKSNQSTSSVSSKKSPKNDEYPVNVDQDYLATLVEGDFPVRVLQYKKNSKQRVKVHYWGFQESEDSWINVKYLHPIPEEMSAQIPDLAEREKQEAAHSPASQSKRPTKRKKLNNGDAIPTATETADTTTTTTTAADALDQPEIKEEENAFVPFEEEPEPVQEDDDNYAPPEDDLDDDTFQPEEEEYVPPTKKTTTRKTTKSKTRKRKDTATIRKGRKRTTRKATATTSNPVHQTDSSSSPPAISQQIPIPEHDTWQKRVNRAIRVLDRDFVAPIACRQQEIDEISSHIQECIKNGHGTCIYVSGKPGTGKTRTLFDILGISGGTTESSSEKTLSDSVPSSNSLKNLLDQHQYQTAYIDCMGSKVESISDALNCGQQNGGTRGNTSTTATTRQRSRVSVSPDSISPIVLILDEVEHFLSGDKITKQFVEELMYFTTQPTCPLILIGIANKLDFRELPLSEVSRTYTKKSVIFKPYTDNALEEIVNSRLRLVGALDLFAPRAIKFLCWKIATARGDARTAIDITQKAVKHIRDHHKEGEAFTLGHFNQLLPTWLPSNNTSTKLESLTQQQKMILMVMLRSQKSFSESVALTIDRVKKECRKIRRFSINLSEMNGAVGGLCQQGIVSMKRTKNGKEEIQILIDRNSVLNYFESCDSDLFLRIMNGSM